jgi:RNA polymerase sigma factor (TIGR02999 family)
MPRNDDVTGLLQAWRHGHDRVVDQIIPAIHAELHRLAHLYMSRERPGHVLQTTALVNEAYLRLVDCSRVEFRDRVHFFAIAATVMRRILVEFARSVAAAKRGGDSPCFSLDAAHDVPLMKSRDVVALDDALDALATVDARKARVIELRFFGGLDVRETAEALGVSEDTVLRDWRLSRAWLGREMKRSASHA